MAKASFEPKLDLVHWRDGREPDGRIFQHARHIERTATRGAAVPDGPAGKGPFHSLSASTPSSP
jgi:hypothetical protein